MLSCGQYVYSLRTTSWITCVLIFTACAELFRMVASLRITHMFSTVSFARYTHYFQQTLTPASYLLHGKFSTVSTLPITTKAKEKKGNN